MIWRGSKVQSSLLSDNSYIQSITYTIIQKHTYIYIEPVCYTMHTENNVLLNEKKKVNSIYLLGTEILEFKEFVNPFSNIFLNLNISITNKISKLIFVYLKIITDSSSLKEKYTKK